MKKAFQNVRLIIRDLRFAASIHPGTLKFIIYEGLLEGIMPFISIYTSSLVIGGITMGVSLNKLLLYAFSAIALTMLALVLKAIVTRIREVRWREMQYKLELKIATKMSQIDYGSLEKPETHRLFRSLWEVENLESGLRRIGNVFGPTIKGLCGIIISITLAYKAFVTTANAANGGIIHFICSPICSIIIIGCIILSIVINIWASKGVLSATKIYLDKSRNFTNKLLFYTQQYVMGYAAAKDIRIYNQVKLIQNELNSLVDKKNKDNDRCENQAIAYQGGSLAVIGLLNLLVYVYVAVKALAGLFSIGNIVRYIGGILQFTAGLSDFLDGYTQLKANTKFMDSYHEFFALPNALHTGRLPLTSDKVIKIEFEDVSFCYPGSEDYALRHFSCTLEQGKRYAIVGKNGSGKTTIVKLLCRLYDPQEGRILLNGIDIRLYDYEQYLRMFSVVFQDFQLFPFSLGQNIAASLNYENIRVNAAIQQAGFKTRFEELADGSETILYKNFSDKGIEVSRGEAQKIAIARAIYKNAPIVVLDEPTAALDPLAEQELFLKFNDIATQKTAVYISHRLSSCKFCDVILVVDDGTRIQQGDHNTLLSEPYGMYSCLWKSQASYYSVSQE